MNKYYTSTGERVSDATIKARLSAAYRKKYQGGQYCCAGCGGRAIETSHILAKAYVKTLHKTELIWDLDNMFPSCRCCHLKWEAVYNPAWCELYNVEHLLLFIKNHDQLSYAKRMEVYEQFRK